MLIGNLPCKLKSQNCLITTFYSKESKLGNFELIVPTSSIELSDDSNIENIALERGNRIRFNPRKDKYFQIGDFVCKYQGKIENGTKYLLTCKSRKFGKAQIILDDKEGLYFCTRTTKDKYKNEIHQN